MKKFWLVFRYEYLRHVGRKRFIFAALSIPLFIAVIMAISILGSVLQTNKSPIGYVDHSGLLAKPVSIPQETGLFATNVKILPFQTEAEARTALESSQIQAYYVLAPDYLKTSKAQLVSIKSPDQQIQSQFVAFIRANLLAQQSPEIRQRITEGNFLIIQSADGSQQMAESDWFNILIPVVSGLLVIVVIMTSGGYLMQAVVEEKENRTMEIIVTSVSSDQLMAGKIFGNICVGLTQLLIWILFIIVGVLIGQNQVDWIHRINIGPQYLGLMVLVLLPTFILIASLLAAIGATVTESREAQQFSGLFTLPVVAPYWFSYALMTNPNGPLAVGLSFFPLTAPVTLTLRAGFTQIPTLQLVANLALLYICAAGTVWLAARTFRLGMLSYGKRLSWRQIFQKQA